MTQECILVFETEKPIPMTCANATGIERGAILKLADPFTVSLANGDGDVVAGIAAEEKIANDGKVKIAVYQGGIFEGTAGGTCTVGKALMTYNGTGDDNDIIDATNVGLGAKTLGYALETAANNETVLFKLMPGCNTNVLA
jgi:hypothetical protein